MEPQTLLFPSCTTAIPFPTRTHKLFFLSPQCSVLPWASRDPQHLFRELHARSAGKQAATGSLAGMPEHTDTPAAPASGAAARADLPGVAER